MIRKDDRAVSAIGFVLATGTAMILGALVALQQHEIALALVGLVLGITLVQRLSLANWCGLLLISTVAVRAPVIWLDLPSAFNFLHYPLAAGFAIAASMRPPGAGSARAPRRWLFWMLVVVAASTLVNGTHPLRAVLFVTIIGEPMLVVWAVARWGYGVEAGKIVVTSALLLLLQLPIALYQGLTIGVSDYIEGTLLGQGASQHILGALNALGMFLLIAGMIAGRVRVAIGILGCLVAMIMIIAPQAIQVAFAIAMALVVVAVIGIPGKRSTRSSLLSGARVMALLLAILAPVAAQAFVPGVVDRALRLASPDRMPEVELANERARSDPVKLFIGSGPGTTASRAALLLTPRLMKKDSPLAALDLAPTEAALDAVRTIPYPRGGSAESLPSSTYGILGDLGLIGAAGLIFVFGAMWRRIRATATWLAPAGMAALVMTFVLNFIDNWIEYPEYAVPLALLLGFSMIPHHESGVENLGGRLVGIRRVGSP